MKETSVEEGTAVDKRCKSFLQGKSSLQLGGAPEGNEKSYQSYTSMYLSIQNTHLQVRFSEENYMRTKIPFNYSKYFVM